MSHADIDTMTEAALRQECEIGRRRNRLLEGRIAQLDAYINLPGGWKERALSAEEERDRLRGLVDEVIQAYEAPYEEAEDVDWGDWYGRALAERSEK